MLVQSVSSGRGCKGETGTGLACCQANMTPDTEQVQNRHRNENTTLKKSERNTTNHGIYMKSSRVLTWKSSWLGGLILFLLFLPLFAQSSDLDQYSSKISPVLKRLVASQLADPKHDNPIPVIVQFQKGTSDKDKN